MPKENITRKELEIARSTMENFPSLLDFLKRVYISSFDDLIMSQAEQQSLDLCQTAYEEMKRNYLTAYIAAKICESHIKILIQQDSYNEQRKEKRNACKNRASNDAGGSSEEIEGDGIQSTETSSDFQERCD